MHLTDRELQNRIEQGEAFNTEFKAAATDRPTRDRIRKTICAFANDLPDSKLPGIIVLGLNDAGDPSGLEISDALLTDLSQIASDGGIVPHPAYSVEKRLTKDQPVAVLTVLPSKAPPVQYKSQTWIRRGPSNALAGPQDEIVLREKRRAGDIPFDLTPVDRATLADLRLALFRTSFLAESNS